MKDPLRPPPLGAMPRKIWLELRAKNLAHAIHHTIMNERFEVLAKHDWLGQLAKVLEELAE